MWSCCFFFKQKTAYEMRISDWSSDVCSSDLPPPSNHQIALSAAGQSPSRLAVTLAEARIVGSPWAVCVLCSLSIRLSVRLAPSSNICSVPRSEEHTSELQSLMRISYAVFCLKKKKKITHTYIFITTTLSL